MHHAQCTGNVQWVSMAVGIAHATATMLTDIGTEPNALTAGRDTMARVVYCNAAPMLTLLASLQMYGALAVVLALMAPSETVHADASRIRKKVTGWALTAATVSAATSEPGAKTNVLG